MTFVRDRRAARRARELLASAVAAMLLLLALGLPALGAGKPIGPTQLVDPEVAPLAADSATPITFRVTYRNFHDLPPEYVRVAVAGAVLAMSGSGTDWKAGVVFTVTATLPAGTHAVRFEARDEERFVDTLEAGTVAVDQAPPPPTPAPTPTPAPDPDPAPTPTPPGPTPTSPGGGGSSGGGSVGSGGTSGTGGDRDGSETGGPNVSAGSDDRSGMDSVGAPTGGLSVRDHDGHAHDWVPSSGGPGSAIEGPLGPSSTVDPSPTGGSATGGSATGGSATGGSGGTWRPDLPWFAGSWSPAGDSTSDPSGASGGTGGGTSHWLGTLNAGLATLVLTGPGDVPTLPAIVGPTLLVTTWMAFMLFNRRRRDGEPPAPDDVLHAAAGTGLGLAAVAVPAAPVDPESLMPRWRRPSLLEARKTDPIRSPAPERARLTFASMVDDPNTEAGFAAASTGPVSPASSGSFERRAIRYAVIPLLDRPDEIMATRIGELVAGDEVQVEQRSGAYCHVLCPDGRRGWVHRTTLGDHVTTAPAPQLRASASDGEPDAENALAALLAARGLR
ncbi:MAG TPA: SH3 domain-containing protein [Candidatus Limnocylindrales bacterium]|nr:SH3 domain-containing protein [Candidatus Limnocylindrales bacterium]